MGIEEAEQGLARLLDEAVERAIRKAPSPTSEDLDKAHQVFLEKEQRDLFYRVAMHMVNYAENEGSEFTLGEALAVLLLTWNRSYYQYRRFNREHLAQIERLLQSNRPSLAVYHGRDLASLTIDERIAVLVLVASFSDVLGPVGAAKALHLLAPRFFPLWDRKIAKRGYRVQVDPIGYVALMMAVQKQCERLSRWFLSSQLLKRLDEYNYCRYSKGWL